MTVAFWVLVWVAIVVAPPTLCVTLFVWACKGSRGRRVAIITALFVVAVGVWVVLVGEMLLSTPIPNDPYPTPHPVAPLMSVAILVLLAGASLVAAAATVRRLIAPVRSETRYDLVSAVAFGTAFAAGGISSLVLLFTWLSGLAVLGV